MARRAKAVSNHNFMEWVNDYMDAGMSRKEALKKAKEELAQRKLTQLFSKMSNRSRNAVPPYYLDK